MKRQILYGSAIALGVLLILGGIKACQISAAMSAAASRAQPPETVTSYVAKEEEWPRTIRAAGSLDPVKGALLSVQESGMVTEVHFASGDDVQEGQLLVSLNVGVEKAALTQAEAQLQLAKQTAERQRALRKRNANAQADLDTAEESLRNAQAEVTRIQEIVKRRQVIAPFDGRAGIRTVNVGEIVQAGAPIVEVHAFHPLYVNFSVPQKALRDVEKGARLNVHVDAFPEKQFTATLTAIESKVDPATRTIDLQATFENKDSLLRPGMFVDVELMGKEIDEVVAVPSSSINYAPYGNTVYLIGKAEQEGQPRPVTSQVVFLGRKRGDRIEVTSGIKKGQEIVSSGTFKLRPGVQVVVNNAVTPLNELHPNPADT